MVMISDIVDAINMAIIAIYPDDAVYTNLLPKDFERPSFLIEVASVSQQDANRLTVAVDAQFVVTCFCEVDGHYNSDTQELQRRQDAVIAIFKAGYLTVGNRCLKVQTASASIDFTEAVVELQLSYFDDRGIVADDLPLIGTVNINKELQEG